MKWSTTLAFGLAPVALAKKVSGGELDARSAAALRGMKGAGITERGSAEVIIIWNNPGNGAKTTNINDQVTVTQTVVAGQEPTPVAGKDGATTTIKDGQTATMVGPGASHTVKVGGPGGLTYQPDQLSVPVGDTIVFEFLSNNHSVTQSSFAKPCEPLKGGMDSGFQANPNNTVSPPPQVAMQVMVDTPLWFHCEQMGHCGKGMTFSVNPTAEKTQAQFQEMAIQQNGKGKGSGITGGEAGGEAPPPDGGDSSKPAPPADGGSSSPPADGSSGGPTMGTGKVGPDGSCTCVVQCMPGSFPAVNAQGIGAVGGLSGSLPMAMVGM